MIIFFYDRRLSKYYAERNRNIFSKTFFNKFTVISTKIKIREIDCKVSCQRFESFTILYLCI